MTPNVTRCNSGPQRNRRRMLAACQLGIGVPRTASFQNEGKPDSRTLPISRAPDRAATLRKSLSVSLEPIIRGGGQQRDMRSGTMPTPLCAGFGAAAEILSSDNAGEERKRIRNLRDLLVRLLREASLPIALNGPEGEDRHPGNANIRFIGLSAHDLLAVLQPRLAASTVSCSSGIPARRRRH